MSVQNSALKNHLWECAEILRGSAVDRTDWKAYILPLLFFKRISDVWDEELAEAAAVFGDADPVDFPEVSTERAAAHLNRKGQARAHPAVRGGAKLRDSNHCGTRGERH